MPTVLGADEPLSAALGVLAKCDSCIIVTKGDAYVGIISDRSVEGITSDPRTMKLGVAAERAPVADFGTGLLPLAKLFLSGPYKSLPVRQGKKIVGVLKRGDLLLALAEAELLSGKVSDFMSSPPLKIDETAKISQALEKMREAGVRRLIVNSGGKLAGILSVYDIKVRTLAPKERLPFAKEKHSGEDAAVSSVMTRGEELVTGAPGDSLNEAARKMAEKKVSAIVVERNGEAVGILSARDVLESLATEEKVPVYLSGLDEAERMSLDTLKADVEGVVEKIARSVDVDYLALHFKKYKHKFSIHARLKTSKRGVIAVSNSGFDLRGTVHGLMDELEKIVHTKLKANPMHEKPGKQEVRRESGLEQR
ncbi:Inosine-5'-monophosphate dehydrogenase [uncultured archaeon]|nr:Inosine-5'-monophosphate dehydrogenase [uncultured archaeon]